MTADFKMKFDDGGTPDGLKKTAAAGDKAADALGKVGQEGADAAESLNKVAETTDSLGKEADQATKDTKEFSASLDDATKKAKALAVAEAEAAAKAKELEEANKGVKEKGERAKEGLEGLQKILNLVGLGGLATAAFSAKELTEGILKLGKGIGALTLAPLIAGLGALVVAIGPVILVAAAAGAAIYGIGQAVLWFISPSKELTEELEANDKAFADMHASVDGVIPSVTELAGKTNELAKSLKAMFEPLDAHKNEVEVKLRIADLNTTDSIDSRLATIRKTIDEIADQEAVNANEIAAKNEALAEAQKKYATEVQMLIERRKQLEDKAEADRLAAIEKREQKEKEAFDAQTARQMESIRIDTENAQKRLAEIEKQKQAEIDATKAAAEEKKRLRQAEQSETEAGLKKALDGIKTQKQAEAAPAQSAPSASGTNPYGEGVAVGGNKPNAFAAQANMDFGTTADFNIAGNSFQAYDTAADQLSGQASGGASGGAAASDDPLTNLVQDVTASISQRDIRDKALAERLKKLKEEQAKQNEGELISRFGTADGSQVKGGANQLEFNRVVEQQKEEDKRAQQEAAREFKKEGPSEDEASSAADQLLQERIATAGKRAGLDAKVIEAFTKMAQKDKEEQQQIDQMRAQLDTLIQALNLKGSSGNGAMPSRGQRVRAATV